MLSSQQQSNHRLHHDTRNACYQAVSLVHNNSSRRRRRTVAASASFKEDPEGLRNKVKHLTRLFYAQDPTQPQATDRQLATKPKGLAGSHFHHVPLWRVEWALLPGMQEILHVLAPHYVHLFEGIFSRPRPWVFGHLYLPGGSKNLGSATHSLASGSHSPLVGVLMQVTRAVRLRDGKFLLLATSLGRFKVTRCVRELPYTVADVELFEDCEVMEGLSQMATTAVMQSAADDTSLSALMAASSAAAREAAAAQHWSWLKGYELKVAARQEWPGPGPREGENDHETFSLVQELAEQGVADVLPLPDGVVIGRCNLQDVAADAQAAVQQALQEAAAQLNHRSSSSGGAGAGAGDGNSADRQPTPPQQPQQQQQLYGGAGNPTGFGDTLNPSQQSQDGSSSSSSSSSSLLSSTEGVSSIVSLNTTAERGVALQGPEVTELTTSSSTCGTIEEVLMLEAAVWQQLDILAALSARIKGRRHALPFGLLQLRPPRPQLSVAAATALANRAAATAASGAADADGAAVTAAAAADGSSNSSSSGSTELLDGPLHPPAAEVVSDTDDEDAPQAHSSSSSTTEAGAATAAQDASPQTLSSSAAAAAAAAGVSSRSAADNASGPQDQWSATTAKYAFAASEGMDVHADPLWPPLRRAAKLSWAAALVTGQVDPDKGDMRQALLETPSVASRLRYVLAVLQKHAKVLAALAAVKDVQE